MIRLWPLLLLVLLSACASKPTPQDVPVTRKAPGLTMPTGSNIPTQDSRGRVVAVESDELVEGEQLENAAQDYRASLEEMFISLKDDLNQCYLPSLKRNPSLQGYVTLRFQVRPGGKVPKTPELGPSTLQNQDVTQCLVKLVQAQTYPEPFNGKYTDVERVFYFGEF